MIRSRRLSRFLPSLLAGVVALLMLAEVVAQWQYVDAAVPMPAAKPAAGAATLPAAQTMAAIALDPAQQAIVLERPLFSPTRRPPPPPPPPSSATAAGGGAGTKPSVPQPPPMNFTLVGIVRDPASSQALLQPTNGKPVLSLRAGQALDGWMLVSIGIDSASFRNGAAVRELVLDFRHAAPPLPPRAPQQ
jgi:hypothetical protein